MQQDEVTVSQCLYLESKNLILFGNITEFDEETPDLQLMIRGDKSPVNQNWKLQKTPNEKLDPEIKEYFQSINGSLKRNENYDFSDGVITFHLEENDHQIELKSTKMDIIKRKFTIQDLGISKVFIYFFFLSIRILVETQNQIYEGKITDQDLPQNLKIQYSSIIQLFQLFKDSKNYDINANNIILLKQHQFQLIKKERKKVLQKQIQSLSLNGSLTKKMASNDSYLYSKTLRQIKNQNYIKSCQIDNLFEVVLKEPLQNFEEGMNEASKDFRIPNYTLITQNDKSKINQKRMSLQSMLNPLNREEAFKDFKNFAEVMCSPSQLYGENGERFKYLKDFEKTYSKEWNKFDCLKWYTEDSFFYKILNKGLRELKNAKELVYLRLPFSDIYYAIEDLYSAQENEYQCREEQHFTCYRSCYFSENQLRELEKLGHNGLTFLQMEGFTSASLKEQNAYGFSGNTLLEIQVYQKKLGGPLDSGFVYLGEGTSVKKEEEILFNAFNYFRVISVTRSKTESTQDFKDSLNVVRLEYGGINQIEEKSYKNQKLFKPEKEILINWHYQESVLSSCETQGMALYKRGHLKCAEEWCQKKMKKLENLRTEIGVESFMSDDFQRYDYLETLSLLSSICFDSGKLEKALNYCEEYLFFQKLSNENFVYGSCQILYLKAKIWGKKGNQYQAKKQLVKAVIILQQNKLYNTEVYTEVWSMLQDIQQYSWGKDKFQQTFEDEQESEQSMDEQSYLENQYGEYHNNIFFSMYQKFSRGYYPHIEMPQKTEYLLRIIQKKPNLQKTQQHYEIVFRRLWTFQINKNKKQFIRTWEYLRKYLPTSCKRSQMIGWLRLIQFSLWLQLDSEEMIKDIFGIKMEDQNIIRELSEKLFFFKGYCENNEKLKAWLAPYEERLQEQKKKNYDH